MKCCGEEPMFKPGDVVVCVEDTFMINEGSSYVVEDYSNSSRFGKAVVKLVGMSNIWCYADYFVLEELYYSPLWRALE